MDVDLSADGLRYVVQMWLVPTGHDSKWGGCGCRRPPPEDSAAVGVARRPRHAWNQVWLRQGLLRSVHSPDRRAKHQVVRTTAERAGGASIVTVEGVSFHQVPMTAGH